MVGKDGISYKNHEGYSDPTAHDAMANIMREKEQALFEADQRNNKLIKAVKMLIDLAGFDLVARIEVRDRPTGRLYK